MLFFTAKPYLVDVRQIVECYVIIHNMTIEERKQIYSFNDLRECGVDVADNAEDVEPVTLFGLEEVGPDEEIGAVLAAKVAKTATTIEDGEQHYSLQHNLYKHVSNVYYSNNHN